MTRYAILAAALLTFQIAIGATVAAAAAAATRSESPTSKGAE
eukprot:CAMPEP_0183726518 /NCGR_PEP_ID=MMETSP0737-20130205/23453_1 /TAXON_ID=385413 /ORGANISM="Thalassiosira miniscula, Strain CCMP1093" /LENGTH=41 /DNA_ID= /DNA_START= /DNA_END= /DNA_ORIENTATION=